MPVIGGRASPPPANALPPTSSAQPRPGRLSLDTPLLDERPSPERSPSSTGDENSQGENIASPPYLTPRLAPSTYLAGCASLTDEQDNFLDPPSQVHHKIEAPISYQREERAPPASQTMKKGPLKSEERSTPSPANSEGLGIEEDDSRAKQSFCSTLGVCCIFMVFGCCIVIRNKCCHKIVTL